MERYGVFGGGFPAILDEDPEAARWCAQRLAEHARSTVAEMFEAASKELARPGFLAIPFAFSTAWFWRFREHIAAFLNHDAVGVFYPHNVGLLCMRAHHAAEAVFVCETAHATICAAAQIVAGGGAAWRQCERRHASGERCPNFYFDAGRASKATMRPVRSRREPALYCCAQCQAAMQLLRHRQKRRRLTKRSPAD